MAPRRGVRSVKSVNNINYAKISLSDVLCPICRCILIQPVTLPCNHDFCMPCFDGTLANANLTCPLCRVRFSSWHRIAKKDNKVVNVKLWDVLQDKFPKQVRNRLQGIEENLEEETLIKLTKPGEIRREYEAQRLQQQEELEKLKEEEESASAELIKKLKEQEDYEEIVREEKLRLDEQVARQLAKQMGYVSKPSASKIAEIPKKRRPIDKYIKNTRTSAVKLEKTGMKDIPQFLNSIASKEKNNRQKNLMNFAVETTDSNDSIENECRYFKPIDHRNIPPSKTAVTVIRVPAIATKPGSIKICSPNGNINFSHKPYQSAFARFEVSSPILGMSASVAKVSAKPVENRKRKVSENISPEKSVARKRTDLPEPETTYVGCAINLKSPSKHPIQAPKKRPTIRNFCIEKANKPEIVNNKKKQLAHKMTLRDRKMSGSPFFGFDSSEIQSTSTVNGRDKEDRAAGRQQQELDDLAFAKKLQVQFNKERYSTRSSITCRANIKKTRQVTLTEIISTSKCK